MILINASMGAFISAKKIYFEIEYVLQCIFIVQIQQKQVGKIVKLSEKKQMGLTKKFCGYTIVTDTK